MLSAIRAVAFDMDGLMFNTEDLYEQVGDAMLQRRGKRICRDLLDRMMGRPAPIALQAMIDFHQLDASIAQLQAETDELFPPILLENIQPMPGLLPLLDRLEALKIPKAVCTSSRRTMTDLSLNVFEFPARFAFTLTADDVQNGKPQPEVYLKAAERFNVAPQEMLVLEDSPVGCQAAVAAGACVIAVPGPHTPRNALPEVKHVAESLSDPVIHELLGTR